MSTTRRAVLAAGAVALAAPLARPAIAQPARVLRFIPEGDVAVLDPIWTTATVTRNHGYLVFDTLYGQDAQFRIQPQMVAGHTTEQDGRLWRLTLREGLRFHDGEPVRAQDVVPSIRRFAARDAFGRALMEATDELSAADDRTVQFRLKKPFPLLPAALGKTGTSMPCIMPERLARTDANTQVTEMVGSGPYRFRTNERVPGSLVAYERFDGYVPRPDGPATFTAGPKRAWFDRVEWRVIPDAATAANALANGEVDWWQNPTPDLQALLRKRPEIRTEVLDPGGGLGCLRFNQLFPPFDNPAIRRALLMAVDQAEVMTAVAGDETTLRRDHVGVFSPDTPMATTAGTGALVGKRDFAAVKRALTAAGYKGEKIVMLDPTDYPSTHRHGAGDGRCLHAERPQRGPGQHRLGHAGAAPQQPQAAGRGRLAHLRHLPERHQQLRPGQPARPARQRRPGLVRLGPRAQAGGAAQRLVRRAGPCGTAGDLCGDPEAVLRRCAVSAAGRLLRGHSLSQARWRADRVRAVL